MLRAWWDRSLAGHSIIMVALTFALGAMGGGVAFVVGLPLPFLLGPMLTVVLISATGFTLRGSGLFVPQRWRTAFIPIVGVAIGAAFPPDFLDHAQLWWTTLAALLVIIPIMHALGFFVYHRMGGIDRVTAFYAAMPGGFIESLDMGEKHGADQPMLIILQFLRLVICIIAIPIGFSIFEGHAVGGASGATWAPNASALTAVDVVVLAALGITGWAVASWARFPAAPLSGPLLASAVAHALDLTHAAPPLWAIIMTQWIMGTTLGCRLIGFSAHHLPRALRLAVVCVLAMLSVAGIGTVLLHGPVEQPLAAVLLAFAPGGVSEMALVAVSLQLSAVYVTIHHLARIILAVVMARLAQSWVLGTKLR